MIMALSFTTSQAQTAFTQWTFENTTNPSSGTGTLTLIGGTAEASTAYPTGQTGLAYSISNFPGDTAASGTAGYQFNTSTTGYNSITVSFYVSGTNQSSRWQQYEYSIDGGTSWSILGNNNGDLTTTFAQKSFNLPAACDNVSNLAFRIVSIFAQPTNSAYESIQGGGYNGNNGKWLIDGVTFSYNTLGNQQNEIAGLKIYPSPAKSYLSITSDNFSEKQLTLYDTLGKIALTTNVSNQAVDISSLSKGVYIAKITEEGKTATRKIIVE